MPWFKVDDKLHSHRKAMKAGEALALWVIAGSWSMDQLSDGFVPDYIAAKLMPRARRHAQALVVAGLWEPGEKDGDTGWYFHDWPEHQPTRESVVAKRDAERDKKRRQRRTPAGRFDTSPRVSPGDSTGTPEGTPEGVPPTRPDPTRPVVPNRTTSTAPRKRGTRIPDDFVVTDEMREWAAKSAPLVATDLDAATEEFVDYWRGIPGSRGTKLDWIATWRNRMREVSERRARVRPIRTESTATGEAGIWRQAGLT